MTFTHLTLLVATSFFISIVGYVRNFIYLINHLDSGWELMLVLSGIGAVIPPLGVILGWIHIFT
jgi:hypothetical protein